VLLRIGAYGEGGGVAEINYNYGVRIRLPSVSTLSSGIATCIRFVSPAAESL